MTFLHDALALPEMGRVDLAKNISRTLVKKNTFDETKRLRIFLEERGISHILHFTPIVNLRSILSLGFVPRKFLELPGIKEAIGPSFPMQRDLMVEGIVPVSPYPGQIIRCSS